MEVDVVTLAAEFPNDNPALHRGVVWVCAHPTGAATPERFAPERAPALDAAVAEPASEARAALTAEPPVALPVASSLEPEVELVAEAAARADVAAPPVAPDPAVELGSLDRDAFVEDACNVDHAGDGTDATEGPHVAEGLLEEGLLEEGLLEEGLLEEGLLEEGLLEEGPLGEPPAPRISGIVAVGELELDLDLDEVDAVRSLEGDAANVASAEDELVVEDLEPLGEAAALEGVAETAEPDRPSADAPSTALPPAPDDPFTILLCTLADLAVGQGSPHAASLLPALLLDGRLGEGLTDDAAAALADGGIARGGEATAEFVAVTAAWRAILRGTSEDFSACGAMMLDEWAADVLARLLGAPTLAPLLRRELRARGVAAFGLVEAA